MMNSTLLPENKQIDPTILARLNQLPSINIYRMLTQLPTCFKPWVDLVSGLYQLDFDMRLREIAICRQAYKAKSDYELHQHTLIAKKNGVTDEELKAIFSESSVNSLDEEANFICKIADEIEENATLSDETREALFIRYSKKPALELITILSFYCCVARVLNSTRIPIESTNPLEGMSKPL